MRREPEPVLVRHGALDEVRPEPRREVLNVRDGPAWSKTQKWDTSQRVVTAADVPNLESWTTHRGRAERFGVPPCQQRLSRNMAVPAGAGQTVESFIQAGSSFEAAAQGKGGVLKPMRQRKQRAKAVPYSQ